MPGRSLVPLRSSHVKFEANPQLLGRVPEMKVSARCKVVRFLILLHSPGRAPETCVPDSEIISRAGSTAHGAGR